MLGEILGLAGSALYAVIALLMAETRLAAKVGASVSLRGRVVVSTS